MLNLRLHLNSGSSQDPELELYIGRSSMIWNGRCAAGYATVTLTQVVEVQTLLKNSSAQKAELMALHLVLAKGKHMDWFKNAHEIIWKESGLLPESPRKYKKEII